MSMGCVACLWKSMKLSSLLLRNALAWSEFQPVETPWCFIPPLVHASDEPFVVQSHSRARDGGFDLWCFPVDELPAPSARSLTALQPISNSYAH